jgi:hypothetical protein
MSIGAVPAFQPILIWSGEITDVYDRFKHQLTERAA